MVFFFVGFILFLFFNIVLTWKFVEASKASVLYIYIDETYLVRVFKYERCYVHNIFIANHWWLVVIGSNLNLTPILLFLSNNNNQ